MILFLKVKKKNKFWGNNYMSGSIGAGSAGLRHIIKRTDEWQNTMIEVIEVPVTYRPPNSTHYTNEYAIPVTVRDIDAAIMRGGKNNGYRLVPDDKQRDNDNSPTYERCDAALVDFRNGYHGLLYRDKEDHYGVDIYVTAHGLSRLEKEYYPHSGAWVAHFLNTLIGKFPPSADYSSSSLEAIPGRPIIVRTATPETLTSKKQPVPAAPLPVPALG